jgi:hypothetical protein
VENSLRAISSTDDKIVRAIEEIYGLLDEYRLSLSELVDNSKSMSRSLRWRIPPARSPRAQTP